LKKIEGLAAVSALPKIAYGWVGLARGTSKVVATGQLGEAQQGARVL
jgi:hypothetical protein